ncbi:MAG: DUF1932 domain-containing protein [Mycobacteriales bacterium]
MARIAILHPGEMGAAIGADLRELGHEVRWLPAGRGAGTRRRADAARLAAASDLVGCDVVISICPPAAAVETARRIGEYDGLYVDANAVSPATALRISGLVAERGATYVDGSVIGAPPSRAGATRLYLSGANAADVASLFAGGRTEARILDGDYAASALKMTYAAWTKISSALLLATAETAHELGVDEALRTEWAQSLPELADRLHRARTSAIAKGWRWSDEMTEIARTFSDAGLPGEFGTAAAKLFARQPRPSDR